MTKKQAIRKWKKLGVVRVCFEFQCGGDSMNETSLVIFTGEGEEDTIEDEGLEEYFNTEVYDETTFYVNSDGVYEGEFGTVEITLNEEGSEFDYAKSSTEEWRESVEHNFEFPITLQEFTFFTSYVEDLAINSDNEGSWNYKKDFVLTDSMELFQTDFAERLRDCAENQPLVCDTDECEYDDYFSLEVEEVKEDLLKIKGSYTFRVFKQG